MLPYVIGGAAALGALMLGSNVVKRRRKHDPRTAATQRLKIVDARHAVTRRMAAVNPRRKLKDEWNVQGNYGYGWDDEYSSDDRADARARLKEYRANGNGSYRLIKRRVPIEATNPKRKGKKGKWVSPGSAAARLAHWRWHHNPPIPAGYKSAAGRRLGHELRTGVSVLGALRTAKIVARQGGDHVAYQAIKSALVAASANRSLKQAVTIARKTARMLGYVGKWSR